MMGMELLELLGKYSGLFVTTVLGGGVGAYIGSYLKKKGENLATHEDIDKLVKQMAAVTQATKEIEAKISNDAWDRQRRWDVKRDVVFQVLTELGELQDAAIRYNATKTAESVDLETAKDNIQGYYEAYRAVRKSHNLILLTCNLASQKAFFELDMHLASLAQSTQAPDSAMIMVKLNAFIDAMKKELNLNEPPHASIQ